MKNRRFLVVGIWLLFVCLSRLFRLSFPIGEQSASISCFAVVLPLIACMVRGRIAFLLIGVVWGGCHLWHPIPITAGIPTLFAALSWKTSNERGLKYASLHILFPLLAMAAFALSPAGRNAWPYTLYWLIPVGCTFIRPTLLTRALQSTFLQHAAGSVIWVYLIPFTSEQWLALIPVVAVERVIAVSLSTGVIGCLMWVLAVARRRESSFEHQSI